MIKVNFKEWKYKTKVKFLVKETNTDILKCHADDVYAYFPKEYFSKEIPSLNHLRTCYAHIGQHSACHPDYAKESRPATPEEYKDLKEELESIGYNLIILP